jgi:hypothetical protein
VFDTNLDPAQVGDELNNSEHRKKYIWGVVGVGRRGREVNMGYVWECYLVTEKRKEKINLLKRNPSGH